jgi:hypothetical protein
MGRISFRRYLMGVRSARTFGLALSRLRRDVQRSDERWWALRRFSSRSAIAPGLKSFHLLALLLESWTILGGDRSRLVWGCITSLLADLLSHSRGDQLGWSCAELGRCKIQRTVGSRWAHSDRWGGSVSATPRFPSLSRDQNEFIEPCGLRICSSRADFHH